MVLLLQQADRKAHGPCAIACKPDSDKQGLLDEAPPPPPPVSAEDRLTDRNLKLAASRPASQSSTLAVVTQIKVFPITVPLTTFNWSCWGLRLSVSYSLWEKLPSP